MNNVYKINGDEIINIPSVTPEDYGAKGDGTTDDYAAFQQMFSGGNKHIVLEPKTYLINGHINVYSNTFIEGNGALIDARQSPFIIGESGDYAYAYDGSNNVEFNNLRVRVNNYATDHIIMAHAKDVRILNCEFFDNMEHSIELNSSKNVLIQNCVFRNVAPGATNKEAINVDPAATGHTLNMGYFDNTISDYVKIIDCLFENCWSAMGNHGTTPYASKNIIFSGCDVRNCYNGVQLHSYKNVTLDNNIFTGIENIGIRLIGTENVHVTNNTISSNGVALNVEGADNKVLVTGNTVTSSAGTPISVSSSATAVLRENNIVNGVIA